MNDGILFISLLYSCMDLHCEWDQFSECQRPIHRWLLVSYACVVAFRLIHICASRWSAADSTSQAASGENRVNTTRAAVDFLLDLRQKGFVPRLLAIFSWLIALPFFVLWTGVGTVWLFAVVRDSPGCVPSSTHLWFAGFWLLLSYVWIIVHTALGAVAWMLELRVRRAELNLRAVEDDDVVSRWGSVSNLANYTSLPSGSEGAGLTPGEIRALPGATCCSEQMSEDQECAICINQFRCGDSLRSLRSCGHTFHRSCIDLWLLRRADCPLCKRCVRCDDV